MSGFLSNNASTGGSGSSDGYSNATLTSKFITLENDPKLTKQRVLTAGNNITLTDGGAGGALTISSTGAAGGAPLNVSYLTLSTDAALPNERVLAAGTNISIVDSGAGGNLTINGAAQAPIDAKYLALEANSTLTQERVITAGTGISFADAGAGGTFTINNTYSYSPTDATTGTKGIIRLTGDLGGSSSSPSVLKVNGIAVSGTPSVGDRLIATSTSAASWQTPASSAPSDASFLTLSNSSGLSNERVLTAGAGISFIDNGADGTLIINRTSSIATSDIVISTGQYGVAETVIAYSGMLSTSLVLPVLTPNDEFDADDLSDCRVMVKPEIDQMRVSILSDGPIVGTYKIIYTVKI